MELYIFGAGASAAEGAPATRQFLAKAWELLGPAFDGPTQAVWHFLEAVFRTRITGPSSFGRLPAVDEVISLVDYSLLANQGLGAHYDPQRLAQVRRDIEHLLMATLDAAVRDRRRSERGGGPHGRFVRSLLERHHPNRFALLSLNYDTLLDDALADAGARPDYGFGALDLADLRGPLLLKLHGSLNWARCPACGRIAIAGEKVAHLLPHVKGLACSRCGNDRLSGLIISTTFLKSYGGSYLGHLWDLALEAIQQAERISFVGYSMPAADIAIYQLILRGLLARPAGSIPAVQVINHSSPDLAPAERRLRADQLVDRFTRLFGPGVRFDFSGFRGQL